MTTLRAPQRGNRLLRRVLRRLDLLAGGVDWRRFVLREKVLRAAVATRAGIARHRATLTDAVERERHFARVSESYRQAAADQSDLNGRIRRIEVDGVPWWLPLLNPGDPASVARVIGQQDFPYRAITQTRELAIGGIMLDIGANIGRMSIPRLILGDAQLVYCAEPEPLNYACLVRNVVDNGFRGLVMPDRVAIGSENTVVRMLRGKSPGGHRVVGADEPVKRETIEVRARTLDTWCDEVGIDMQQVTFIKVDAQGSELHVLRGAPRMLAYPHVTWQIEVDEALLKSQGDATDSLFAMLQKHFTHFIDLNKLARGPRLAPMEMLPAALSYIRDGSASHTDILVFRMPALGTSRTP
jgi:FkbM family methyltransferase